ncbi:MAG: metallophosphoesterase [Candidatus Marinimicrobia bacterium]|nr:metallophosphoesterase [Candidatus Neomarinimicrobiota bacterium]
MKKHNHLLTLTLIVILFTISVGCQPAQAVNEDSGPHFYFVQVTDTHFGDGDNYERVEKIVETINNLPMEIKCVVHTGDITSNNIEQDSVVVRGISIMDKLQVPIHFVPGNHDILEWELDITKQRYLTHFGNLIDVKEYEGILFIFVYTETLAHSFEIDGYDPLLELEAILKDAAGKPAIIFHHTPSPDDFYRNEMHDSWKQDSREKWEKLLNSYNIKAVMAGHFHRDEHHWLGDVPLYVSAPVGGWWGRQASFRIFEYKNGKLGYRTQYIEMNPRPNK